MMRAHDTIAAPATAPGGAIAVVRVSGERALELCDRIFRGRSPLCDAAGHTLHFGRIVEGDRTVDEVLAAVFRAPRSYTGEDSVELSCHGSSFIVGEVLRLLTDAGARIAEPGEFTVRAYLSGKMDLSQAEAVGDLVASSSRAAHTLALNQMRGGYSDALEGLREKLLHLASLLELELDFAEEDVAFADRGQLRSIIRELGQQIETLRRSFRLGNALKQGVAVAIAGAPNVGKSTLLNRLLHDERALVSDIAGTTRDVIEELTTIDGVTFRFLDTAGIRTTRDRLERLGIERTMQSIERAQVVIHLVDAADVAASGGVAAPAFAVRDDQKLLTVINKTDLFPGLVLPAGALGISARNGLGIEELCRALRACVDTEGLYHGDTVVSSSRHYAALSEARAALGRALEGLDRGLPTDLLCEDVRQVIRAVGTITGRGALAPDDILRNIFSNFCIGK